MLHVFMKMYVVLYVDLRRSWMNDAVRLDFSLAAYGDRLDQNQPNPAKSGPNELKIAKIARPMPYGRKNTPLARSHDVRPSTAVDMPSSALLCSVAHDFACTYLAGRLHE